MIYWERKCGTTLKWSINNLQRKSFEHKLELREYYQVFSTNSLCSSGMGMGPL